MIVLNVCFRELKLGKLFKENGMFVYKTNQNAISKAKDKWYPVWLYHAEKDFSENELPLSLLKLLPEKDSDTYKMAQITENDDELSQLEKVAKLDLAEPDFHVEL